MDLVAFECRECLAWTVCERNAPGGPALCEHPSSGYRYQWLGDPDDYVDCGFQLAGPYPTIESEIPDGDT